MREVSLGGTNINFHSFRNRQIQLKPNNCYHYNEDRAKFTLSKKFRLGEIAQERIILIPYTTFWALLESYNSTIKIIGGKDNLQPPKHRIW